MNIITIIGTIAAVTTTISFVPQVLKIYRSKNSTDISLSMYLMITTGISLWLIYGILIKDTPIIIANGITLIMASAILVMKLKYK